jgi:hypothetical protein
MRLGICLKGRVVITPLVLSLTVRIARSASLTCTLAAVVLHSRRGTRSLIFSNSPSIKIVLTVNHAQVYTLTTRSICLARLLAIRTGTCFAVTNLILLNIVIKKAVPFTKKMSAANVTILFSFTTDRGTAT